MPRLAGLVGGALAVALATAGCGARDSGTAPSGREVEVVLGNAGGTGNADGRGDAARFDWPSDVVALDADTMLVADGMSKRIRRVTRDGEVTSVWAGPGFGSAVAGLARLPDGAVLVPALDAGIVRRIATDGRTSVLAGRERALAVVDGIGPAARFEWTWGGFNDAAGHAYVFDSDGRRIRRVDADGRVTTLQLPALDTPPVVRFVDLAPAADGGWWALDDRGRRVYRLDARGEVRQSIGSDGAGAAEGDASTARFDAPRALDARGELVVVTDPDAGAVWRVAPDGSVRALYRAPCPTYGNCTSWEGPRGVPPLRRPRGIAILDARTVAVTDADNGAIYLLDLQGRARRIAGLPAMQRSATDASATPGGCLVLLRTVEGGVLCRDVELAGFWSVDGSGATRLAFSFEKIGKAHEAYAMTQPEVPMLTRDAIRQLQVGPAAPAVPVELRSPDTFAAAGDRFYGAVSDQHVVLRLDPSGREPPRILAGREGDPGARDGPAGTARFREPRGVAVDGAGNVFVADGGNHAIRRIAPDGTVSTWAGRLGARGSADGVRDAARFEQPSRLSVGRDGSVFVVDEGLGAVRRIDADGRVTTYGGVRAPRCGDCAAGCPADIGEIDVDPQGRVWSARGSIVSILPPDGPARRVLGTQARAGLDPRGSADVLPTIRGLAFDADGNLLLAVSSALLRVRADVLEKRLAATSAPASGEPRSCRIDAAD